MSKLHLELTDVDLNLTDATRVGARPSPAVPTAPARAFLQIQRCPDDRMEGVTLPLRLDDVRIGRTEGFNTFALNDDEVSREHIALIWRGSGYVLSDLQSTNGTQVNGSRIATEVALKFGDVILVGKTALRYDRA